MCCSDVVEYCHITTVQSHYIEAIYSTAELHMTVVHVLSNGFRVGRALRLESRGCEFDSHEILEIAIFPTGPGCMGLRKFLHL